MVVVSSGITECELVIDSGSKSFLVGKTCKKKFFVLTS